MTRSTRTADTFGRMSLLAVLAVLAPACNQLTALDESDSVSGGSTTVPQAVLDAFQNSCALGTACHGAGGQTPALEAANIGALIGTQYVNIGDVQGSYIAVKMLSQGVLDNLGAMRVGARMPLGFDYAAGDPTTLANTEVILAWIAGADFPGGAGDSSTGAATDSGMTTGDMTTGAVEASFANVRTMLFKPACSCHQSAPNAGNGNLELSDAVAYANIVDQPSGDLPSMPYVTPMDPSKSYLYLKLTGEHLAAGGKGSKMPLGPALSDAQMTLIADWITAGAPEN